jgi:hypothetical protein
LLKGRSGFVHFESEGLVNGKEKGTGVHDGVKGMDNKLLVADDMRRHVKRS